MCLIRPRDRRSITRGLFNRWFVLHNLCNITRIFPSQCYSSLLFTLNTIELYYLFNSCQTNCIIFFNLSRVLLLYNTVVVVCFFWLSLQCVIYFVSKYNIQDIWDHYSHKYGTFHFFYVILRLLSE